MSNEQQGTPVPPQVPQNNQAPQQGWQAIGQQPAQPAQPAPPAQPQAWQAPTPAPQPQAWQAPTPAPQPQAWQQPTQAPQPQGWQQPAQAPQPQGWQQPNQGQQQAWNQQAAAQQPWGQGQQPPAGPTAPTWEQLKASGRYQIPPEYPAATFNPESFSIAAFFFNWIWYMVKGMWQKGLVLAVGGMILSFFTGGIGGIAVAIYGGMFGHRDYMRYHNSKAQFWW